MREIKARFTNLAADAVKVHTPGGEPLPVKVGEKVHPPGLFTSGDEEQLKRLAAAGALSDKAVSHGHAWRAAQETKPVAAPVAPLAAPEAPPASQQAGVGQAGPDAAQGTGDAGGMRVADGDRGGFAGDGSKPGRGGRRAGPARKG